jgi:hypothetical protein
MFAFVVKIVPRLNIIPGVATEYDKEHTKHIRRMEEIKTHKDTMTL